MHFRYLELRGAQWKKRRITWELGEDKGGKEEVYRSRPSRWTAEEDVEECNDPDRQPKPPEEAGQTRVLSRIQRSTNRWRKPLEESLGVLKMKNPSVMTVGNDRWKTKSPG
ncbi:unnamed protein product [Cochlearia groenlandica]